MSDMWIGIDWAESESVAGTDFPAAMEIIDFDNDVFRLPGGRCWRRVSSEMEVSPSEAIRFKRTAGNLRFWSADQAGGVGGRLVCWS